MTEDNEKRFVICKTVTKDKLKEVSPTKIT